MQQNVYTLALLTAKEGCVDSMLAKLESLANATRKEHGCIEYGFYRDNEDSNRVISFERWVDQAAEDAHWETPHLKQALAALDDLLSAEPVIIKAQKVI